MDNTAIKISQRELKGQQLDNKIELFFFDHRKTRDDYIEFYREFHNEKYLKEGGKRYSPLFLIMKEIKHALLLGSEFNFHPECRKYLNMSVFTSIILIRIAFDGIAKSLFSGDFPRFAKDYLGIKEKEHIYALNLLRNSLEHNFWTLWCRIKDESEFHDKGEKIYFSLSFQYTDIIIRDTNWKTKNYKSSMYRIHPRRLYVSFANGIDKLKKELLDRKNHRLREIFDENIRLKHWIFVND